MLPSVEVGGEKRAKIGRGLLPCRYVQLSASEIAASILRGLLPICSDFEKSTRSKCFFTARGFQAATAAILKPSIKHAACHVRCTFAFMIVSRSGSPKRMDRG
jgi:hypothetical protein